MSVLIDPYMFELDDENEIKDNIAFFQKIVKLATFSGKDERIKIALYKGLVDKIQKNAIQPFPIQISNIKERDLKMLILQLDQSFRNILLDSIECLDVESCYGNQDFSVDGKEVEDDRYYELFSTLLIPCYSKKTQLDNRIITGKKLRGKQIGDEGVLECNCVKCEYNMKYLFVDVGDIIPPKEKAVYELKKLLLDKKIEAVDTVEAEMGDHHNLVQADKKKFRYLRDLSNQNKIVLRQLTELGLFKIIFGRQMSHGARAFGTFSVHGLNITETQDILVVKFTAETKMVMETFLYFPKGVGELLYQYFQDEQITYNNTIELIEKLK